MFILTELRWVGERAYDWALELAKWVDDILNRGNRDEHLDGDGLVAWASYWVAVRIEGKAEIVALRIFQHFVVSHLLEPWELPTTDEELELMLFIVSV